MFNTGYCVLYSVMSDINVSRTDVDDPNSPGVHFYTIRSYIILLFLFTSVTFDVRRHVANS